MSDKMKRRLALILLALSLMVMVRYEVLHYDAFWYNAIKDDLVSFIMIIVLMLSSFILFLKTKHFEEQEDDYYGLRKKCNKHRKKRDMPDDK